MTRPDPIADLPEDAALRHALAAGADGLTPSPAPYAAIVHGGRRLRRRRTATRAGLLGAAVLVPALTLALLPGHRPGAAPAGPASSPTATKVAFEAAHDPGVPDDVRMTKLSGRVSGVSGEILVWLPPQYDDPAYQGKTFPVVELLSGRPAAPDVWFSAAGASEQLKPLVGDGSALPFILVAPQTSRLAGEQDNGCADRPGGPKAESWLTKDVPQLLLEHFRVQPEPQHWALAGYANGAHCATRLALNHPDRYGAAVSINGYNDPATQPGSPVGPEGNPLTLLSHSSPKLAVYATGNPDAQALAAAAHSPTTVTVAPATDPHDIGVWRTALPGAYRWLTQQLK
ncbi:alpha/beta hydrolase-fold protein [Kitasatospora sp. NPDC002227]|uniref:alpha/beta hydrolase n=1 Tax=Kitasatospora sp. NPDC002227 TaxID=3154773 RepID=UPI003330C4CA